jgi:hypothetical protein
MDCLPAVPFVGVSTRREALRHDVEKYGAFAVFAMARE